MIAQTENFGGYLLTWTRTAGEEGRYDLQIAGDQDFLAPVTLSGLKASRYAVSAQRMLQGPCYWRVAAVDRPHGKHSGYSPVYLIGENPPGGGETVGSVRLAAYPNPSPGAVVISLFGSQVPKAECSVFDVSGRLVETLDLEPSAGCLSGEWGRTGPHGETLPPGVYYAIIRSQAGNLRRKIVLVR
jgi:hypothetical protein